MKLLYYLKADKIYQSNFKCVLTVENIAKFQTDYSNCFTMAILLNLMISLQVVDPFSAKIDSSTTEGYCSDYLLQH